MKYDCPHPNGMGKKCLLIFTERSQLLSPRKKKYSRSVTLHMRLTLVNKYDNTFLLHRHYAMDIKICIIEFKRAHS